MRTYFILTLASLALAACGSGAAGTTTSSSTSTGTGGATTSATSTTSGSGAGGSGDGDILTQLQAVPGLTVEEQPSDDPSYRYYVMSFDQPADHQHPEGVHFAQRLTLLYHDQSAPMVLATTGYDIDPAQPYAMEPTSLLDANQLLVEHRFFSPSRPSPADWTLLTIQQAAADHHAIVTALKSLFTGKWISTGASKGGMTSVYHRRFYPDDVDGTVAYVAPQSYGDADPRYVTFLQQVGDPTCRAAVVAVQTEVLKRRASMLAHLAQQSGHTYALLGADGALDYSVIELAFTFWQYYGSSWCSNVPAATATDDDIWSFLDLIDSPTFWDDTSMQTYEPYYFQAGIQLGYPGYDDSGYASLLKVKPGSDVAATFVFPGPTKSVSLDPQAMMDVASWLSTQGKAMLFVYGQNDPYSAAAFDPTGATDSYRFFAPDGTHGASIADLVPADQQQALAALGKWAGVTPKPHAPHPRERLVRRLRRPL